MSRRKRHIIAVDLDGTLIDSAWPGMGDWKTDAVWAMREFLKRGYVVFVFTVRISPYWLDGTRRDLADVEREIQAVRDKLDSAGLHQVSIWTKEGKPPYSILIDDKVITFPTPGSTRSWRRIVEKVLLKLGAEDPLYEDGGWGWEEAGASSSSTPTLA